MAENRVQCPNCMGFVVVPILEVGMTLNCPMCGTHSRISKEIYDRIKQGEAPISERVAAVADLPQLPGMGVGEETADADTFADDDSANFGAGVPGMPGMGAPGMGAPGMGAPGVGGGGMQGRGAAMGGQPGMGMGVPAGADEYPGLVSAGMTPTQAMAEHRKQTMRRAGGGDTGFRSRIIGDYHHEKLAKLAVDVGNTGRTRGYMAAVLLLIGSFVPVFFLLQEGNELTPNPKMKRVMSWEFSQVPQLAEYEEVGKGWPPAAAVESRTRIAGTTAWVYVVGMPALALFGFVVARFARYRRRGWYYLIIAAGVLGIWQFNPFSHSVPFLSPIRQYDPMLRGLDALLVCAVGVQLGLMAALRYFHDMKGARWITAINTVVVIALSAAIIFNLGDRTMGYGMGDTIKQLFDYMPVKVVLVGAFLGAMTLFPLMLIVSPTLTIQALTNFATLALLFTIPLAVVIGASGNYDVPTTVRHWFGIFGVVFLVGTGITELLNNRLLDAKVKMTLEDPEDWWGPEFQRMRLDARYHARMVRDEEYRREYKRLTEIINEKKYAHMH